MSSSLRIGIVGGAGWLGSAIAGAIIDAKVLKPKDLTLSYRSKPSTLFPNAKWTMDNEELASRSDVLILSVRPGDWDQLHLNAQGKLVISVMPGIRVDELRLRHNTARVVRCMPNAATAVQMSYTPWFTSSAVSPPDRTLTRLILGTCGLEDEVHNEYDLDYFTGLSGAGPAFPAMLGSLMIDEAVAHGISSRLAERAVKAVLIGTGRLLDRTAASPKDMIESFINYRGTTEAAIKAMLVADIDLIIAKGLSAAYFKSLSREATSEN
ncbi:pyrroline-5-carboxylate reductase dimerization domain-containing protein [Ochrobactrum vermis]|uniref:Pyrroline-5-carboxylate reductase dimerization domain-containing protein n=1 Tax=Ochrobactrum vermis TaxID=1827297 RepID=A0ABU8PKH9_9HYPH|nr:pyrroline-5-carboxylate reductase dimerization domain-containing protein [Ochrobactrum vermis]PQZ26959.1 pyrroline-5-carboxylate reductase [Ochrobactrum vermis]